MAVMTAKVLTDGGAILTVDVIQHAGKFWMVPYWLDRPNEGGTTPNRIIRLDSLPHERMASGSPVGDFVVKHPIPKALLEPETPSPPIAGFEYQELPDIRFAKPPRGRSP